MNIPLCKPSIGEEEIRSVTEVLRSGWLAHGPKTKEFELSFAKLLNAPHAITFNSCASALHAAIAGLERRGEIILPSFTFSASANAIVTAGCTPVFVDIRIDTCNIDEKKIEAAITDNTIAIMPVHFAGHPCEMEKIMEIANRHQLRVIEDSAECLGATYDGKQAGSFDIGCFSFYPTKNITCGEGGMVVCHDSDLASSIATLRAHGIKKSAHDREIDQHPWFRDAVTAGFNFRMSDIQAAIGVEQLKKLGALNAKRIARAEQLTQLLGHCTRIRLPVQLPDCTHVYQMYTILLDPSVPRPHFIKRLRAKGVAANVHFDPPVHLQSYYQKPGVDLPVTQDVAKRIVTLPLYPDITPEQIIFIAQSVKEVLHNAS